MTRRPLGIAVLVLIAVVLVGMAIKGPKGFLSWIGVSDDAGSADAPDGLGLDEATPGMEGAAGRENPGRGTDAERAGILASRHIERRGVGGLSLKIVRAGSGAAVEGATVLVTGTGHGGEDVRADAVTDATGAAKFARLAAGQGYVVQITSKSDPAVDRPDVEIKAGRDKDLGSIEIGATAALTGRVLDAAGKPVAGAQVHILTGFDNIFDMLGNMAEMFGTLSREPTPLAKGTTGDDGRFRLEGLPPGPLVILASASGKRQTVLSFRMTPKGPASGPPTLVLEAGSVIAGVVVDSLGAPVVGAHLTMIETGDNDPTAFFSNRSFTTSGPEGRFRTLVDDASRDVRAIVDATGYPTTFSAALKPGVEDARIVLVGGATVEVRCEDEAHAPIEGAAVTMAVSRGDSMDAPDSEGGLLSGSTDVAGLVTFVAAPGKIDMLFVSHREFAPVMGSPNRDGGGASPFKLDGEVPKEVAATGVTKLVIRMKRGLVIRGRVLDPSGNPIVGAEVRSIGNMGFGGGAMNRSAADGTYQVTGGAAGAEGGGMGGFGGAMITAKAAGYVQKTTSMTVDASQAKNGEVVHDITLLAGAVVRGKVLDADGRPLVGAEVRIASEGGFDYMSMMGGGGLRATTAEDGTYELRDVSPSDASGSEFMSARAVPSGGDSPPESSAPPKPSTRVSVTAEDRVAAKSEPFLVTAGATVDAPTVKLSAGATLHGKVREPSGRPAAGAIVEVSMERDGMPNFDEMMGAGKKKSVKTDSDGAFVARALAKAKGTVIAKAQGFAPTKASIEVGETDPAPIELRLLEEGDLKGRVATQSGEPIAGAMLSVSSPSGVGNQIYVEGAFTTSDKNGQFTFKGLPRTTVEVAVNAKGHRNRTMPATVGGEAIDVRLEARGPNDERRRDELKKELSEIYAKFATVKDDAERNALVKRMSALQIEQQALDREEGASPSAPTDRPPAPPESAAPAEIPVEIAAPK